MNYVRTFSTLGCPELNLEEVLALAASHGLPGAEIRALGGTIDLPAHFEAACGTPNALAERLCLQHVKVFALDTSLKLAGSTATDREEFLKFLPWAEALGVARLRVFDGGHDAGPATHREMADTVAWWRALRSRHGWRPDIMVETHDALFSGEAINRFLSIAPGTGILWDTHNTWRASGEDPLVTWRAIRPHVVHMHVKDSVSIPSGKHSYTYSLPGDGEFPMAALREVIREEFDGPVSLEWERLWHPELAPLEDALEAATRNEWW
ncbi:MAG TPA: sugar phosphate isomerase/epimerase [Opitutaceae bacterium]|nr:sugar phosphate isomerase/epimerase [Opitutaceae bacterium]